MLAKLQSHECEVVPDFIANTTRVVMLCEILIPDGQ